jgi:hypothetical protein
MTEKFRFGQRTIANYNAPAEYAGQLGTILRREPDTLDYWVRFDGDYRGVVCLGSRMLDLLDVSIVSNMASAGRRSAPR